MRNVQPEQDRQWFNETFAPASQLESRLIPDILDAKAPALRKAAFPIHLGESQLDALQKRFSCREETLLDTAFGLTLSVWSAGTKACFFADREGSPIHPVFVEWTPDQPVSELLEQVARQEDGAREHAAFPFEDGAAELELDRSILFGGPVDAGT